MSDMTQISRTLGNIEAKVDGINVRLDTLNGKTARHDQRITQMEPTVQKMRHDAENREKLGLKMRERIIWAVSILVVLLLSQRLNIAIPKTTTDLVSPDEIVEPDN
jgi:hypothetical protein